MYIKHKEIAVIQKDQTDTRKRRLDMIKKAQDIANKEINDFVLLQRRKMKSIFLAMGVVSGKIDDIPEFIEVKVGKSTFKFPLIIQEFGQGTNTTEAEANEKMEKLVALMLRNNDVPDNNL